MLPSKRQQFCQALPLSDNRCKLLADLTRGPGLRSLLFREIEKWMTNLHPASQRTGPGPYIWPLMLMLMQLTIDAVHWSATYMAGGKRAKATLKN